MMKKEKVTMDDLRAIPDGKQRTFLLETSAACVNAKSLASMAGHRLGCRFSTRTNFDDKTITITKQ